MIQFKAQYRIKWTEQQCSDWVPVAKARKTMERARSDCREVLLAQGHVRDRLEFQIVATDEQQTVCQTCAPPHGERLKWIDVHFVRREAA